MPLVLFGNLDQQARPQFTIETADSFVGQVFVRVLLPVGEMAEEGAVRRRFSSFQSLLVLTVTGQNALGKFEGLESCVYLSARAVQLVLPL